MFGFCQTTTQGELLLLDFSFEHKIKFYPISLINWENAVDVFVSEVLQNLTNYLTEKALVKKLLKT